MHTEGISMAQDKKYKVGDRVVIGKGYTTGPEQVVAKKDRGYYYDTIAEIIEERESDSFPYRARFFDGTTSLVGDEEIVRLSGPGPEFKVVEPKATLTPPSYLAADPSELHQFETGAVRSKDADNVRYDLITPIGILEVAKYSEYADVRYGSVDSPEALVNECLAETYQFLSGSKDEPHLVFAALAILHAVRAIESNHD